MSTYHSLPGYLPFLTLDSLDVLYQVGILDSAWKNYT